MGWIGRKPAENQCEQSCEAWKIKENPNTKKIEKGRRDNTKIRRFEEIWTSVERERVAKATQRRWPKEKELLDKGDGLATAAGARLNDEVTSQ